MTATAYTAIGIGDPDKLIEQRFSLEFVVTLFFLLEDYFNAYHVIS